jgi:branched-subunit amino acid transport protein AzlD
MVIGILLHCVVSLLLLRSLLFLVLNALNDAVLVQFELAFLIRAVILVMIHIALENYGALSVADSITT